VERLLQDRRLVGIPYYIKFYEWRAVHKKYKLRTRYADKVEFIDDDLWIDA